MGNKLEVLRVRGRVELVHPDLLVVLACKQVTTMGEHDLTALFDEETLVGDELFVENVHHANGVAEADHEVES